MRKIILLSAFVFITIFSSSIIAQSPLPAGTYTIGNGGYFQTLASAFGQLNLYGIAGPVTLELIDTLYASSGTFALQGPIPGAGPDSRVTIKPADNKHVTIEGIGVAWAFSNVSYLTLDGVGLIGATTLTVHALSDNQENDGSVSFGSNSDHNVVQNITVITDNLIRSSGIGVATFNTASIDEPDSNLIQNNFIKKAWNGIYVASWSSSGVLADGNIIRGNIIGSTTDSLISWGINAEQTQNTIIEGNIIQNIRATNGGNGFPESIIFGIRLDWCNNGIIRNNIVHNVKSNILPVIGIFIQSFSDTISNNNLVYNNMVYDIECSFNTSGIVVSGQENPQIYYNSVYLTGTGSGTDRTVSTSLSIDKISTNVIVKNNIFVNARDEFPGLSFSITGYTESNLTSDNNDLYCARNQNSYAVNMNGTKYSFPEWQAKGHDLLSVSELPNFIAPDLHIDESIPTYLEKRGTPITVIDTDFDGNSRDANLPDIGADEIDGQVPRSLSGGYSVGTAGYFPTISDAFDTLSTNGIAGPTALVLTDTLYTAPASDGFMLNGPISGAGLNTRITLRPAANKNVIVEGSGFGFQFSNVNYLTLDGVSLSGTATLTVRALLNAQIDNNIAVNILHNSDHDVVQNITAAAEDYKRLSAGIAIWEPDINSSFAPDSNLIQNNFIKESGNAIYLSSWTLNTFAKGNVIRDNIIGSENDSLIFWGIQAEQTQNTVIEGNNIQNLRSTVNNNLPPPVPVIHGINLYWGINGIIRNNAVHTIKSFSNYPCTGILLSNDAGQQTDDNLVYNNMIYDIQSNSSASGSYTSGIEMWNQDNPKIYYNSVYLTGNGNGANQSGSAALWINNNCMNVDIKNNIFLNARTDSPYTASSVYYYSSSLTSDNNDLFYLQNQNNCLVQNSSSKYSTLSDWQAEGQDLQSITEMPNFKAPHLHIDENIPTDLESHGTPIAGIELDFDGDARDTISTDIGADEFNGSTIVGVKNEEAKQVTFALYQNYPNPFNPSTIIKYSISKASFVALNVYNILGQEVRKLVNEEKPSGNYEVQFNAANLPSGVYFCRIRAGSYNHVRKMLLIK
jgi:Secretion system C-terminal sorting domain